MRSSPEARRLVTLSSAARDLWCVRNLFARFLLCIVWFFICLTPALAQSSPQTPAPSPTPQAESKPNSAEIASHDEPTTFKVNVKLVVVRAVVRDSQGHAVGNLQKEDFEVFDKGKPQVISQFEVEQPGALTAKAREKSDENSTGGAAGEKSSSAGNVPLPERFVAYLFDDVHLQFGDLAQVRKAAERHFATLKPTDRAAIFTTSGVTPLDFTDDRAQLNQALLRMQPRALARSAFQDCPDISYYQADLIVNKNDPQALNAAIQDFLTCPTTVAVGTTSQQVSNATMMVSSISQQVLSAGDHESRVSLSVLKEAVHSLSRMPGQRSIVLVSPGFITPQMEFDYTEIIDRAVRSQVVISSLDARGLYVPSTFADASRSRPSSTDKMLIESAADSAQADLLAVLADSTGGVFFHNSNDFEEGFRRVAETPEYSYVLAFVPQNLKLDGSFHTLKVKLKNPQKLTLQARRGYYAPKTFASPEEQAKQEIEDAMFSQEELHNLPVNLHTQFFKASDADAKLVVLAHVDVKRLHFRKVDGRNYNVLTCVSGIFDRNGKFLQATEKTVTMRWKDETLQHGLDAGKTLKTSFDVKPGSYTVRLVVRDSEGQLMSAENGTVEIR